MSRQGNCTKTKRVLIRNLNSLSFDTTYPEVRIEENSSDSPKKTSKTKVGPRKNSIAWKNGLLNRSKSFLLNSISVVDNSQFEGRFATELIIGSDEMSESLIESYLHRISSISAKYIGEMSDRSKNVINFLHPHQLRERINESLMLHKNGVDLEMVLNEIELFLSHCVKTGHPRFFNQLSQGLDIMSLSGEWLSSLTNANMFTYEIAPVFTLMEEMIIKRLISYIGWTSGDGIFAPGGAISNLYAILAARYNKYPQIKTQGLYPFRQLACFTSQQAHYSVKRAAAITGIGTDNVYYINCNREGQIIASDLERKIDQVIAEGKVPLMMCCLAGTTVMGAFDEIRPIAEICKKHNMWLHIDAAWGGALLLLEECRKLFDGVEEADSVTWNPHKALGATLQCSAILVRHENILENCNSMAADYLFQKDKNYDTAYDTGDKTIQCGRHNDILKFWMMWKAKGDDGLAQQIRKLLSLSEYMQSEIKRREGFKPLVERQHFLNVCFWYLPVSMRHLDPETSKSSDKIRINSIAPRVKALMMQRGKTMVGYQPLDNWPNFFRMIISNVGSNKDDIDFILDTIEQYGEEISADI